TPGRVGRDAQVPERSLAARRQQPARSRLAELERPGAPAAQDRRQRAAHEPRLVAVERRGAGRAGADEVEALRRRTALVVHDPHADDAVVRRVQRDGEDGPVERVAAPFDDLGRDRRDDRVALDPEVADLAPVEGLDAGADLPEPVGELHYLPAPAVMPRESVRWQMRKKLSVGSSPSRAEALVVVTSMRRSPCRTLIATGTV